MRSIVRSASGSGRAVSSTFLSVEPSGRVATNDAFALAMAIYTISSALVAVVMVSARIADWDLFRIDGSGVVATGGGSAVRTDFGLVSGVDGVLEVDLRIGSV